MTRSLTEAVARALCVARKPKPADAIDAWALLNHWAEYGSADASLEARQFYAEAVEFVAAIEAAGFVVVPREPTEAMVAAGYALARGLICDSTPEEHWSAMIAARPGAGE